MSNLQFPLKIGEPKVEGYFRFKSKALHHIISNTKFLISNAGFRPSIFTTSFYTFSKCIDYVKTTAVTMKADYIARYIIHG